MKSIELFKSESIKTKYFNKVYNQKRIGFLYFLESLNELHDITIKYYIQNYSLNNKYEQDRT